MERLIDANRFNQMILEKLKEPQYQHEGDDWQVGLIMAQDIAYECETKSLWISMSERKPCDGEVCLIKVNPVEVIDEKQIKAECLLVKTAHYYAPMDKWYFEDEDIGFKIKCGIAEEVKEKVIAWLPLRSLL